VAIGPAHDAAMARPQFGMVLDGIDQQIECVVRMGSPDGMQHDECRGFLFRFARKIDRSIPHDAKLHPSVYDRFKLLAFCNTI
jgi:hypothetical protein